VLENKYAITAIPGEPISFKIWATIIGGNFNELNNQIDMVIVKGIM